MPAARSPEYNIDYRTLFTASDLDGLLDALALCGDSLSCAKAGSSSRVFHKIFINLAERLSDAFDSFEERTRLKVPMCKKALDQMKGVMTEIALAIDSPECAASRRLLLPVGVVGLSKMYEALLAGLDEEVKGYAGLWIVPVFVMYTTSLFFLRAAILEAATNRTVTETDLQNWIRRISSEEVRSELCLMQDILVTANGSRDDMLTLLREVIADMLNEVKEVSERTIRASSRLEDADFGRAGLGKLLLSGLPFASIRQALQVGVDTYFVPRIAKIGLIKHKMQEMRQLSLDLWAKEA